MTIFRKAALVSWVLVTAIAIPVWARDSGEESSDEFVQAVPEEALDEVDIPDNRPFAKGDMEPGVGLSFSGIDDDFYLSVGGSFAYYVVNRLAPGLELWYTTVFSDFDYPESFTLLPFVKFVIIRSFTVAPFLVVTGGREFEWGSDFAVDAWIVGGGGGVYVHLWGPFGIQAKVLALNYWYDDTKVVGYDDEVFTEREENSGRRYFDTSCLGDSVCRVYRDTDPRDKDTQFRILVTIGPSLVF